MSRIYEQERARQERKSTAAGIVLAAGVHVLLLVIGVTSGLKYLYPPPPEQSMLVEFVEMENEVEIPEQVIDGTQPRAVDADPQKELNLVQKAEAQLEGSQANEAPEATVGEDGDVEVPEPPRKPEIDRRALFHAADKDTKKDTLAPQTAEKPGDRLKAGHALGNTRTGRTSGEPNARLKGRSVVGTLPKPVYGVQAGGIVVVDILVDRQGNVRSAVPGGTGTTVSDKTLWEAARKAALDAQFNVKPDAPVQQAGTITYIFKLK